MYNKHEYKIGVITNFKELVFGSSKFSWFLIGLLFMVPSCKKDVEPLDIVPAIEVVSINPGIANEYNDEVTIRISYTDGDGDLGENNSSVKNCFVTDNRIGVTSSFRIKQLAPEGSSIPIKGFIDIEIGGQGITNGTTQQDVTFSIYVIDRAGHRSNSVSTSGISIRKP